jgi:hypothetical protein
MRDHSRRLSTAEFTVIAIAVAGGGTAVVTAAATATGAARIHVFTHPNVESDGSWLKEPPLST